MIVWLFGSYDVETEWTAAVWVTARSSASTSGVASLAYATLPGAAVFSQTPCGKSSISPPLYRVAVEVCHERMAVRQLGETHVPKDLRYPRCVARIKRLDKDNGSQACDRLDTPAHAMMHVLQQFVERR